MIYRIKYSKQVVKFLKKQDKQIAFKIVSFFDKLKNNPRDFSSFDVKSLRSFEDKYRLRVGKYRIIFSVNDTELLVEVIKAGSRGDIY